jgi:ubiquitin-protein ligase E3 A
VLEEEALAGDVLQLFSNVELLGTAFILGDVSTDQPALDFERIRKAYSLIEARVRGGEVAPDWLTKSVSWFASDPYSQLYLPRAALVLLVNPAFLDPEHNSAISSLLTLLAESQEHLNRISPWLDCYPSAELSHLNNVLQQFMTINLCDLSRTAMINDIVRAMKALELVHTSNTRVPRLHYSEFYNDAVNKEVDLKHQYEIWLRTQGERFTFVNYSWVLDAASKSNLLQIESLRQMNSQIQQSMMMSVMGGSSTPFFVLQVRRENLLEDTLGQLVTGSANLKKQLRVKFVGEDGVDVGGVKKEFFQLIVREMFDPVYTMFCYSEDTHSYWFNPDTLESNINFELVGTILGLAIYNGVILDVHLPLAAYKKLLSHSVGLKDLEFVNPVLAKGLEQMQEFQGDVEETYCRHFYVETEAFGALNRHELCEGGMELPVTKANVEEYVRLYVDWILSSGIEGQFKAFHKGFWKVCGGQVMQMFSAEELELMVCGNPKLDFYELQRTTRYEGFTEDSSIVRSFWEVLHSLTEEQKKKFLFFVTGSDRAPINGLSSLELTIMRNGPDCERLMTASTCFNMLLLPEYSSGEKLKRLLLLAISNAEGFGLR